MSMHCLGCQFLAFLVMVAVTSTPSRAATPISGVDSASANQNRAIASEMRELERFTRSGVKSDTDYVRPLAPTRLRVWVEAANEGLADGQFLCGICQRDGLGTQTNVTASAQWFRKAAEQGHVRAQYELGCCYAYGIGIERDRAEAARWWRKAAEQGLADAQTRLGGYYQWGINVEKNPAEAVAWYRKAAEQGNAEAQVRLGFCYDCGEGVEKNDAEAFAWYRKAAEQGYAQAQEALGDRYARGDGVEKSATEAVAWYREAAEQGDAFAQDALGDCFADGKGVGKNVAEAVAWYNKAAEQGKASAHNSLGVQYSRGFGVVQSDMKACVHYLIANALSGDMLAANNLRIIRDRLSGAEYALAQREATKWVEEFRNRERQQSDAASLPTVPPTAGKVLGTGSGFVISADGYFLTCAHVVEGGREISVQIGEKTHSAKIVRIDSRNDVALLKMEGDGFRPLPLSQSIPEMGDKVFTVGFPNPEIQGGAAKYTEGAISALSGIQDDVRTMQITAPIQGGNSGGALVDAAGSAVGLVVAQLNAAAIFEYTGTIPQNVNFAVKINYALPLIQAVPNLARHLPRSSQPVPKANLVKAVEAATGLVIVCE